MRDFDPTASEFISSGYIARSRPGGLMYDPGTIFSVAAPIVGGLISGNAASDAAATQAGATDRANALTKAQYDQTRADLAPWRTTGSAANNLLAQKLGIGGGTGAMSYDAARAQLLPQYSKTVQGPGEWIDGGASSEGAGGGVYSPGASSTTIDENSLSAAISKLMAQNPGTSPGADYGSLLRPFTGADLQNEPGYQFGLNQGMTALDRSLQRGGMMFSGAALKGAQRFGQDYAGTKYGDAFNRDASQKRQQYDFLSGQSSAGQNAANMTSNAGTAMAGTIGANTTALGNAAGAAQIAQGNALSGGLTNAANGYQQNQLVNKILGGNSGFSGAQAAFSQTGLGSSGGGTGLAYGNQDYGQYF